LRSAEFIVVVIPSDDLPGLSATEPDGLKQCARMMGLELDCLQAAGRDRQLMAENSSSRFFQEAAFRTALEA
jgi:hypothetical protein